MREKEGNRMEEEKRWKKGDEGYLGKKRGGNGKRGKRENVGKKREHIVKRGK